MAYFNVFSMFLFVLITSSVHCDRRMKCVSDIYKDSQNRTVGKESCLKRPCVLNIHGYDKTKCNITCFSEFLTLYKMVNGRLTRSDKLYNNNTFLLVSPERQLPYSKNNNCISIIIEKDGHFLEDGSFFVEPNTIYSPGEYVTIFRNITGSYKMILVIPNVEKKIPTNIISKVTNYARLVSCFFLVLVLGAYALCKELRTTAGVNFMSYVACVAINLLLIFIRQIIREKLDDTVCYYFSALIHFFTISSFMWMDVMCFDIWWTLRKEFYLRQNKERVNYRKYLWYCCIAFMPSLAYVAGEMVLEMYQYGPKFNKCTEKSNKWYMTGPKLALQLLTIIPLFLTIFNLRRLQVYLRQLNSADSARSTSSRSNAYLFIKIIILSGTNWFVDLIIMVFSYDWPYWLMTTLSMFNCFFGVILFFVYILKADVLLSISKRLSINNSVTRYLENVNTSSNTSRNGSCRSNSSRSTLLRRMSSQSDGQATSSPAVCLEPIS